MTIANRILGPKDWSDSKRDEKMNSQRGARVTGGNGDASLSLLRSALARANELRHFSTRRDMFPEVGLVALVLLLFNLVRTVGWAFIFSFVVASYLMGRERRILLV